VAVRGKTNSELNLVALRWREAKDEVGGSDREQNSGLTLPNTFE
jgi:hypothetical protein